MLKENESCLLWEKARGVGEPRGLHLDRFCPMEKLCTGETCVFIEPVLRRVNRLSKFYGKLEKHRDLTAH
jgi:hypothetical protein